MVPDICLLLDDFIHVANISGILMPRNSFSVQLLIAPHKPPSSLPPGKMAVYLFFWINLCLKVGKVGPNSQARYASQHYNPTSSNSNLSKSVLLAKSELGIADISESTVGKWIKENTDRVNILIDAKYGMPVLTLLESFLQCRLKPRFEGFESQSKLLA